MSRTLNTASPANTGDPDGPEQNNSNQKAGYIDADRLPPARQNPLATHGRTVHRGQKAELTIGKNDVPLLPRHRTWWLLVVLLVPEGHELLAGLI
jgi:hypothetical protein